MPNFAYKIKKIIASKSSCPKKKTAAGIALVETIFYIAVLVILLAIVINMFLMMARSYTQLKLSADLQNSAILALDRITREVRNADNVDVINSAFGTDSGILTLNTTNFDGLPETLQFYIDNGVLSLKKNGGYFGQLTASSTITTRLMFKKLDNGKSSAIKTEMRLETNSATFNKSANFYSTTIIGNSY